ncbi:MAG: hypothetical protein Ct9H300mP4_12190 [Gammaproteobacteria bacterium]|nr:MAG: hypothetical protein Ct9H300mP4_12190 [Gammaproteobacteria bacterium]
MMENMKNIWSIELENLIIMHTHIHSSPEIKSFFGLTHNEIRYSMNARYFGWL